MKQRNSCKKYENPTICFTSVYRDTLSAYKKDAFGFFFVFCFAGIIHSLILKFKNQLWPFPISNCLFVLLVCFYQSFLKVSFPEDIIVRHGESV